MSSRDTRLNEEHLKALEDHAEAMAREQAATIFDPVNSLHDQFRQEKYESSKSVIPLIEKGIALTEEDVRKRRDALAELGRQPQKPLIPWLLFIFGAILIGVTVAPTLHDFFFSEIEDQRQAWFFSVLGGTFAGLVLSWSLLATFESTASQRVVHYLGLVGGVLFGFSLMLIRLIGADSKIALTLSIGLAILEISVVILMDWVGRGLRHQFADYDLRIKEYDRRFKELESAKEELHYRQEQKTIQQGIINEHIRHVYDREARVKQIENLIRGSRQAIRDGYLQGLSENEGRIYGK
ncbi:MAG: hypothetical protein FJ088_13330 [Deltaproteobacteria bacterium]|nr:hypothetical protein [Deltaproteobacteria bacterium]